MAYQMINNDTPEPKSFFNQFDIGVLEWSLVFFSIGIGVCLAIFVLRSVYNVNIYTPDEFYFSIFLWPPISIVGIVVGIIGTVRHNSDVKWGLYLEIAQTIFFGFFWCIVIFAMSIS